MVLRTDVRSSSPSPSTERNYSTLKSKLQSRVPTTSHHRTFSRHGLPSTNRTSSAAAAAARARLSIEVAREEHRDEAPSRDEGETVCDYDTSATVLYELLESSTWERARARCRSHPEEVRTWIVRKDKSLAVRWKLLPLHAAIIFQSPNFLVSALLDQYPAAASRKDDQGMLPLHLAFRHKQEDEDLLELLLVKYPKAVMTKDRRDRVPLEHGRESKFSAKLMRLYADAVTAASRLMGRQGNSSPHAPILALTTGERAMLEKDHKEELANIRMKYEAQLAKLKGMTSEQLQSLEEGAEKRVELIRVDYEAQIRKLKDSHEQRFSAMRENHQSNLNHVEQAAEDAHNALVERHAEEVNELRILLNNQITQDRELSEALEKEIAHLQVAVQERRAENDFTVKQNTTLEGDNQDLRNLLTGVQSQHLKLQEMMTQQQEDIEAAQSIRNQLVQTLMRQDEGMKTGPMMDQIEKLRHKIAKSLDSKQASRLERDRLRREHGETRLERDREDRRKPNSSRVERDRDERRDASPSRLERVRGGEMDERQSYVSRSLEEYATLKKSSKVSSALRKKVLSTTSPSKKEEFDEVRILADEISAITDQSDY